MNVTLELDEKPMDAKKIPPLLLPNPKVENAIWIVYGTVDEVTIMISSMLSNNYTRTEVRESVWWENLAPVAAQALGSSSIQRHRLFLLYSRNDLLSTEKRKTHFVTRLKIPQTSWAKSDHRWRQEPLAQALCASTFRPRHRFEIVAECNNGFEGVKLSCNFKPDLVFLDIPNAKIGFEMLEMLLTQCLLFIFYHRLRRIRLIKAFGANAIDYLLKPFSKGAFILPLKNGGNEWMTKAGKKM